MVDGVEKAAVVALINHSFRHASSSVYLADLTFVARLEDSPDGLRRLRTVWQESLKTWQNEQSAIDFLFRQHPMLSDERPMDVAVNSESGVKRVSNILGRLRYGSAA